MKQVSEAYSKSMSSSLRNQSYCRVILHNEDTSAAEDGTWASTGEESYSDIAKLDAGRAFTKRYATHEPNYWILDGESLLIDDDADVGFVSDVLSDENGEISVSLTRTFTTAHTFSGITLAFDTVAKEWPESVTIVFYLDGESVGTAQASISGPTVAVEALVEACDKLVFTFGKMLPCRRLRLNRITYGVDKYFYNDEISSLTLSNDIDPLSRRLPQEKMAVVLLDYEHKYDAENPSGEYKFIDEKASATVQFGYTLDSGEIEWVKGDRYVLTGRPTTANNKATFSGVGLIGSMTGTYYKSKRGLKTLYDMAVDVLEDADLDKQEDGSDPWVIDERLKEMYSTAVLPIDTHMNCLQLIAHAARCQMYTDDDNVIHIEPFGVTVTGLYSGNYTDNGHADYSSWESVDKGANYSAPVATLELNRWLLDGEQQISDDTDTGYVSSQSSGADGTFAENPYFTRTFDVARDIRAVGLRFDSKLDEWSKTIQVEFYAGDALLDTVEQTVAAVETKVYSTKAVACTHVVVTCLETLPFRRFRVEKVSFSETDFSIDFTTIVKDSQSLTKIDKVKAVTVNKYSCTEKEESTLYEAETTDTEVHIEFSGAWTSGTITVTGDSTTVESYKIYGRAIDLVLSPGTKTIVVTGKLLEESSSAYTLAVNSSGEVDEEANPLITNDEMAQALAAHVAAYLQMRNTYDLSYRGNPELETGDIVTLQTPYTDALDGLILTDEITFNGSLSGKLKVKALI